MAFNFDSFLGGLQGDEDFGALASLLGKRRNAAPGDPQEAPGAMEQPVEDIQVAAREPRTGMFGIKGTFRDILGTLGDALSEGTGGNAIYRPQRENERYSDALGEDILENPENALDRLQTEGFGKEALSLAQQIQKNQIDKSRYENEAAYKKAQTMEQGYKNLGSMFATADEKTFPALREIAKRRAATYGIDEGELPSDAASAKRWGLDPYRRNRLDQFEEEGDLRKTNVNDQIADRSARRGLTARGQDISASTSRSNNAARIAAADRRAAMTDSRVRGSAGYQGKGGRRPPPGASGGPHVGYKNKNGLTFRGGDPNDRKNWK